MKLRDINFSDTSNNLYEMTRIDADNKAFFQTNTQSDQVVHKFYIEGNDIVLSPSIVSSQSGYLNFYYYLRPNQLVVNDRASTVQCFEKKILIDNDFVDALDTITIDDVPYTAVSSLGGTISDIEIDGNLSLITSVGHQLSTGQTVVISSSDSSPSINGTFIVTVINEDTFTIPKKIASAGTTGTFTCKNQFLIGASSILTAGNLSAAISNVGDVISSTNGTPSTAIITICYEDIYTEITTSDEFAFILDDTTIGIKFESLPNTYTDPLTNTVEDLFEVGTMVDFLQTNPGHKIYKFNIEIPNISETTVYFDKDTLMTITNTNLDMKLINLQIGDYICLAGESIIPQLPPELHTGLAERASARVLAALGDREGLAVVNQKIEDIRVREGNLVDDRVTGAPKKVSNRHSILRYSNNSNRRRF
jgi:hypothetical protein